MSTSNTSGSPTSNTLSSSSLHDPLTLIHLRPFTVDPPSGADVADLIAQRVACGWHRDFIPFWINEILAHRRLIWFIHLPTASLSDSVGMIALNINDPTSPALANRKRMEITSLFVYPEYRRRGVAEAAMRVVEDIAKSLGAEVVTLNTAAGSSNMRRYGRMGYREFGHGEKKYPLHVVLALGWPEDYQYAAFMEKTLVPFLVPQT